MAPTTPQPILLPRSRNIASPATATALPWAACASTNCSQSPVGESFDPVGESRRRPRTTPHAAQRHAAAHRRRSASRPSPGSAASSTPYAKKHDGDPGRVTVRRLTSGEYAYAIQDLTGIDPETGIDAASDSVGGEGFTNFGDVQFMQDANLERYLEAAKIVANHAVIGAGPLEFYHRSRQDRLRTFRHHPHQEYLRHLRLPHRLRRGRQSRSVSRNTARSSTSPGATSIAPRSASPMSRSKDLAVREGISRPLRRAHLDA